MANALEAASLVMIPSGYEDGTLGSLKPIDGSGDFTFTRGTDIGATRVAPDGYIEKGYENLLLQSNSFSNATWTKSSVSVTSGQSGYDGTNDAWKIVPNTQVNDHRLDQNTSVSGVWTFTGYFKAAGYDFLYLLFSGLGNSGKIIDISPNQGIVVDSKGGTQAIDESITDVGNYWWKITLTYSGALGTLRIITLPANDTSPYAGDGTSGILIQDAQLNQGLLAMPYLPTTTTTSVGGILANQPRIDFTGGGCGSLLLEPSRTNLITNSNYFEGFWSSSNTAEIYNNEISPEGLQNAVKVYPTTTGSFRGLSKNFGALLTSTPYTFSVFAKAGELEQLFFYNVGAPAGNGGVWFNVSSGIVGTTSASWTNAQMEDYGNGWYRCSAVITPGASGQNIYALLANANNSVTVTSNGSDGLYLFGTQLEQGSYPTSLIPTYGTSVTRAKDVCRDGGDASTFNDNAGTIFLEIKAFSNGGVTRRFSLSDGSSNNRIELEIDENQSVIKAFMSSNGATVGIVNANNIIQTERHKIILSYNSSAFKIFIDGVLENSDTSIASTPISLNRLDFLSTLGGFNIEGLINQTLYFPTALSDAECIELTTI